MSCKFILRTAGYSFRLALFVSALLIICSDSQIVAQRIVLQIVDAGTSEALPYATVTTSMGGYSANAEGRLFLSPDQLLLQDTLVVSYVSYIPRKILVGSLKDGRLHTVSLQALTDLPVIEVSIPRAIHNGSLSALSPQVERLRMVPQLGGQRDIMKALQLLPGISGGQEATAGLNIRGGNDSHTHLLIDGNEVYNANHIGGLLSSVPDFGVKNLTIHKGGIPARFGGRLSGVVDLRLRDGRLNGSLYELGIGLGLLSAAGEGQLIKNVSFLVAGRFAYPLLVDRLLRNESFERNQSGNFTSFGLADGVAKVSYRKDQTKLSISYFRSGDAGFSQGETQQSFDFERFGWSTNSLALNGVLDLSPKLTAASSVGLVSYGYKLFNRAADLMNGDVVGEENSEVVSNLNDLSGNANLTYSLFPRISLSTGARITYHDFTYTNSGTSRDGSAMDTVFSERRTLSQAAFLSIEGELLDMFDFEVGIRRSGLADPDFAEWEPRARLGVRFPKDWGLNLGVGRQVQYVHRLRAAQTIFPNEFWQIATADRPPAIADQIYGGFARTFSKLGFFLSAEIYAQRFDRLTESNPLLTNSNSNVGDLIDEVITQGRGTSHGLEVYLDWQRTRWDFSLAYTLSKTNRSFPGLNDGEVFPFTYDRRHDISFTGTYRLPKEWTITGVFIYQTGRAISVPTLVTRYYNVFSRINNARFPAFHLLNLGVEKRWSGKQRNHIIHRVSFSTYNTYNRDNPYFIGIEPVRERVREVDPRFPNSPGRLVTVSLGRELMTRSLFPLIPGIAYRRTINKR